MKPTSAMVNRLREFSKGKCYSVDYGFDRNNPMCMRHHSGDGSRGLTYVMLGKMEDAGLIEWVPRTEPATKYSKARTVHVVTLTEAGRAATQEPRT